MKYFIDTEFAEGIQERPFYLKGRLGNRIIGMPKPTIDLISIGIVAEDGREYYAISKEFNLKEAWNRFELKGANSFKGELIDTVHKVYWLRDNVLKPIFEGLHYSNEGMFKPRFTYRNFKRLVKKYGKTNKQIAQDIHCFVYGKCFKEQPAERPRRPSHQFERQIEFYGYYCDYDWVVFCWLFGKMIDLPKGFPMYCIDLKQIMDEKAYAHLNKWGFSQNRIADAINKMKEHPDYPKQTNEHNALADASWNFELYKFLQTL